MKNIFALLIFTFLNSTNLIAQDLKIEIEEIRTQEKILKAVIDDTHKVSIYLKFVTVENNNRIYSVKGWCIYENTNKKIPLVGIYNGSLFLYSFKTKELQEKILKLDDEKSSYINDENIKFPNTYPNLENLVGYDEKFVFSKDEKVKNEWSNGKKKLTLKLKSPDFSILEENRFLKIDIVGKRMEIIKLEDIGIFERNIEFVNYKIGETETNILLKYNYQPRIELLVESGYGEDKGYIILKFDKDFNLNDISRIEIKKSTDIYVTKEIKGSDKIKIFQKHTENEKTTKIVVDEELIQFKVE